jgi:hypothetical protein
MKPLNVSAFEIPEQDALDSICVYFTDYELGKGHITITCFGNAWTSYFGAMGEKTIREFVSEAGWDYLVNKLGSSQVLKQNKHAESYLTRIVKAVKAELNRSPAKDKKD